MIDILICVCIVVIVFIIIIMGALADNLDSPGIVLVMALVILIILGIIVQLLMSDFGNNERAAEKAQQICQNRGFDVYTHYKRIDWSDDPLGVTCGYVSYDRKAIDVESDDTKTIVVS